MTRPSGWCGPALRAPKFALDMLALYEQCVSAPATPHMVEILCPTCRRVGWAPDPGLLTCPRCGGRTSVGKALGASSWADVSL